MITINLLWKIFILFLKQFYANQLGDVKDAEENCKLDQKNWRNLAPMPEIRLMLIWRELRRWWVGVGWQGGVWPEQVSSAPSSKMPRSNVFEVRFNS